MNARGRISLHPQHPPRIHQSLRVQRLFDGAHEAQRNRRFVLFELVEFEAANAMFGRNRSTEFRHRVILETAVECANRAHSAVTQNVIVIEEGKVNTHAAFLMFASGQLRFLGS